MPEGGTRRVIVAGAGIAGLTAALAFARQGFTVHLLERLDRFGEVGAGIQLSPNATRLLDRLGVLGSLLPTAVAPEFISLRSAYTMKPVGRFPLGKNAVARWNAPYIVAHRADLQSALVAAVRREVNVQLTMGASVIDADFHSNGVTVSADMPGGPEELKGLMLVGADGVWSRLRKITPGAQSERFSGSVAWRTTVPAETLTTGPFAGVFDRAAVTAFLGKQAHLVSYPVRTGIMLNLVAVTQGSQLAESWANEIDSTPLQNAFASWAPPLAALPREVGKWTAWPLFTADPKGSWTHPQGLALIGDAAHAMTPYAAQGAAMAIEDAFLLARLCAEFRGDMPAALHRYETLRRPRVQDVITRGAFNKFVWHASGPIAWARDLILQSRSQSGMASDLDWLYGFDADTVD